MRPLALRVCAVLALLAAPALASAQVITSTWNGGTGNWTNPALWAPAVPNNGTPPGATYDAVLNGNGVVTLDTPITIQQLTLQNGAVTGANVLTANGALTWSGGFLVGGGTATASGGATLTGGLKTLGKALTVAGSSNWTAGNLTLWDDGSLIVPAGALLRTTLTSGGATGTGSVNVAGTLRRVDAGGETFLGVPVFNTGRVEAHEGTLNLAGGGASTGVFDIGQRAALRFTTDYELNAGTLIGPTGTAAFSSGAVIVDVPYDTRVTMMNGGSATFTVAARTSEVYQDSGAVTVNNALVVGDAYTWVGGAVAVGAGATLTNGNESLFQANGPRNITGTGAITNHGTFRRSGDGATAVSPAFTNFGTVQVTAGTLNLAGGGTNFGTMTAAAGAALRFTSNYSLTSGSVGGAGTVAFTSGNVLVTAPFAPAIVEVNGGSVDISRALTLTDVRLAQGTLRMVGPATITGPFSWTGGTLTLPDGPLTHAAGSLLSAAPSIAQNLTLIGSSTFTNAGTLRKTRTNSMFLNAPFVNTGTMEVLEGTVFVQQGGSSSGPITVGPLGEIRFDSTANFDATGGLTGGGRARIDRGTVNIATSYDMARTTVGNVAVTARVNFNGPATTGALILTPNGAVGGTGAVTVSGTFDWADGRIDGSGTFTVNGLANFIGNVRTLEGRSLILAGPTILGTDLNIGPGAALTVVSGRTLTAGDVDLVSFGGGPRPVVHNEGTITVTGSNPLTLRGSGLTFINNGTVQFGTGGLVVERSSVADLRPGSTITGRLTTAGTVRGGGAVTGPTQVNFAGPLLPATTVAPGDQVLGLGRIGTLSFGAATFQGGTAYAVDLGSANPRTGIDNNSNDRLTVAGALTFDTANALNVLLNVDGFGLTFQHAQTYDWYIARFGSISGFDPTRFTITPSNFSGGGSFAVQTAGNDLVLSFTAAPEPSTLLLCGGAAAAGFVWHRRRKGGAAAPAGQ